MARLFLPLLLLTINVYILNAHENHQRSTRENVVKEGIAERSAQNGKDLLYLHRTDRRRRETKQTEEELILTTEAQLESKKKEKEVKHKNEKGRDTNMEDHLKLNTTESTDDFKKTNATEADKNLQAAIKWAEQHNQKEIEREKELQAKRKEAIKRNKFFLNPRKEKELRNKIEGRAKEEDVKSEMKEKVKTRKDEGLKGNETKAKVKTNQTDPRKFSWSTIKFLAQQKPKSELKFQLALEGHMRTLKNEGDLVNYQRLKDKFKKAFDFQREFHEVLLKASESTKKGKAFYLTPIQREHYDHLMKIKAFAKRLIDKGMFQRKAITKGSDKMLEYWFKYVEQQEENMVTTIKP